MKTSRVLALLLFLGLAALAQTPFEQEVWRLANEARRAEGLSELAWDDAAYRAARGHALDMLERGYFDHVTPEGVGPAERMWAAGVLEVMVGENLAFFENLPAEEAAARVVEGWLDSPPHRANLLNPEFTHVGIAFEQQGGRIAVVQNLLARPFEVRYWATPTRVRWGRLAFEGSSRAEVAFFVDGAFWQAYEPPRWRGALELRPGSEVVVALREGGAYVYACGLRPPQTGCDAKGLRWKATYEEGLEPGVRLQLGLPPGDYVLAYGDPPRPFEEVYGSAVVELPSRWGLVWIGKRAKNAIKYTHRIPLTPDERPDVER